MEIGGWTKSSNIVGMNIHVQAIWHLEVSAYQALSRRLGLLLQPAFHGPKDLQNGKLDAVSVVNIFNEATRRFMDPKVHPGRKPNSR